VAHLYSNLWVVDVALSSTCNVTDPLAPVTETDAGHFLQEEVPEVIAEAIVRVFDKLETLTPNASE
jgi:pimeloyl-ACP methyl ester carboxylesterase